MSEWKEYKLGDLSEIKGGKRLPLGSNLIETVTSHPYIRTRDINNNKIVIDDLLFVPDEVFPAIKKYIVEKGDVIVSIVGTIGLCSIIPPQLHLASLTENCAKIVDINEKLLDRKFLFYYLISADGQDEIYSRNVGSTQPKLPLYNIKDIPICLPPLPEQKAIAAVLSSLDDKIDLLHRQNKTLEAMAETLFRQWFVEEADEGWEEGKLGDIMILSNGKSRPCGLGHIPVYGGNGILDYTDQYNFDKESIIIGRVGAYCGSLFYENTKIWVSDNALHAKARNEQENLFLFFLLKTLDLNSFAEGSSHPLLTQTLLNSIDITISSAEKRLEFNAISEILNNKIASNKNQIRTLENLRDTLLPKLMSGEVQVAL